MAALIMLCNSIIFQFSIFNSQFIQGLCLVVFVFVVCAARLL